MAADLATVSSPRIRVQTCGDAHLSKGGRDDITIIAVRLGNGAYPGRKAKPLKRSI
jgi:hypothetical protein